MNEIVFWCPDCGVELEVPTDAAGEEVDCPDCDAVCVVPFPPAESLVRGKSHANHGHTLVGREGLPSEIQSEREKAATNLDATISNKASDSTCLICGAPHPARVDQCPTCGTPSDIDLLAIPQRQRGIFVGEILETSFRLFFRRLNALLPALLVEAIVALVLYAALLRAIFLGVRIEAGFVVAASITVVYCIYHALHVGHFRLMLSVARGEPIEAYRLIWPRSGNAYIRPALAMIAVSTMFWVAIAFGAVLGLVPALVFALLAWPCGRILVDRDVPPGVAISQAVELTVPHWPGVLSLTALLLAIQVGIGLVAVGIGQFIVPLLVLCFVIPFSSLVLTVTYLRLSDEVTAVD